MGQGSPKIIILDMFGKLVVVGGRVKREEALIVSPPSIRHSPFAIRHGHDVVVHGERWIRCTASGCMQAAGSKQAVEPQCKKVALIVCVCGGEGLADFYPFSRKWVGPICGVSENGLN